jgi:hypothetical protein
MTEKEMIEYLESHGYKVRRKDSWTKPTFDKLAEYAFEVGYLDSDDPKIHKVYNRDKWGKINSILRHIARRRFDWKKGGSWSWEFVEENRRDEARELIMYYGKKIIEGKIVFNRKTKKYEEVPD